MSLFQQFLTVLVSPLLPCATGIADGEWRLALCLLGRAGNRHGSSRLFASDGGILHEAHKSIRAHIIEANERRGWRVYTFVHSPDTQLRQDVERLYVPSGSNFSEDVLPARTIQPGALKGYGRRHNEIKARAFGVSFYGVVQLMRNAEQASGRLFDAVIVLRLDLLLFRDLLVPDAGHLREGVWVGAWCEPRSLDSMIYGNNLRGRRCGRLHAHALSKLGVPDYIFIGTSSNIALLADWGPKIDHNVAKVTHMYGKDSGMLMLHGGGHTLIRTHLSFLSIGVRWLQGFVEGIDYTVARRRPCPFQVDWKAARENVGLVCEQMLLNGRCRQNGFDHQALKVCPHEGLKVCAPAYNTSLGRNCSLLRQ